MFAEPTRTGCWSPRRAARSKRSIVDRTLLRSPLVWLLVAANILAAGAVSWISWTTEQAGSQAFRVTPVSFADLPGWKVGNPHGALWAFRRSCAVLENLPGNREMGGAGYAGRAADWAPACKAIPSDAVPAAGLRAYFETWFAPLAIAQGAHGLFTGYYEPELSVSWSRNGR